MCDKCCGILVPRYWVWVPGVSIRGVADAVGAVIRVEENGCVDETMVGPVGCCRCDCVRRNKLVLGHGGVECCGYCVVLLPPDVWMRSGVIFVFKILAYAIWVCVDTELHVLVPKLSFEKELRV